MDGSKAAFLQENKRQTEEGEGKRSRCSGAGLAVEVGWGGRGFNVWGFDLPVNTLKDQHEHPEVTQGESLTQQLSPVRWDLEQVLDLLW